MALGSPRRSCLSVPGSSEKMLAKAPTLAQDQSFLDLEDSVAPLEKVASRDLVVKALNEQDWSGKTIGVRVNAWDTQWTVKDVIAVVEGAGEKLDFIMLPKVQDRSEVQALDLLLTQLEKGLGLTRRIGIEAQIENPKGLVDVDNIASASDRLETIIFGPGDFAAAAGMPSLTVGAVQDDYPGDHWHYVLMRILMAARANGLQAIDGPYAQIRDIDGFREVCTRSKVLGYDGKWALNPAQIEVLNEVFLPSQDEYDRAEAILDAYKQATDVDRTGAVMFGDEMIDEASRKMAVQVAEKGRAAGMKRSEG
ncbi:MAG: CoA ester lyase [Acidimicrobiia bacterium]|nr:CoA ester lyase [Acidimicrobiia bacterium]